MHRALHPQADDRLWIYLNNGRRGMISAKDCVEMETDSLKKYIESNKEQLPHAVEREIFLEAGKMKKSQRQERRTF